MTIHLPNDLESSVQAVVQSGHFASVDDAMATAVRLLLQKFNPESLCKLSVADSDVDPVLGCMKDDAELMDQIVADAMKRRRDLAWPTISGENPPLLT